jgi:HAMP domain-containing protein
VLAGRLLLGGRPFTAVLMAPLEEVDRELGLLLVALLLAVPAALAVSGVWGYLMARKALAPMERLRRSTEDITAFRLDRRLPVANPHDELGRLTQTVNAMRQRRNRWRQRFFGGKSLQSHLRGLDSTVGRRNRGPGPGDLGKIDLMGWGHGSSRRACDFSPGTNRRPWGEKR